MTVLVTGAAGFIGAAVCEALLRRGETVVGVDSLDPYYEVALKEARLARLAAPGFAFVRASVADRDAVAALFAAHRPRRVVHLAAQAGVRHGISHPFAYGEANLAGFLALLEACRHHRIEHLVFASSSSVYGAGPATPFSEDADTDHPLSLYAATKKANEAMAHAYAHLYGLPSTGLRFFTVYGPWGRPDMAPWQFVERILAGAAIDLHNHGRHARDFTFIDDVADAVVAVLDRPAAGAATDAPPSTGRTTSPAPWRLLNVGRGETVELMRFIGLIEKATGRRALLNPLPMQPGDVERTEADVSRLQALTGIRPRVGIDEGIERFVAWFKAYRGVN